MYNVNPAFAGHPVSLTGCPIRVPLQVREERLHEEGRGALAGGRIVVGDEARIGEVGWMMPPFTRAILE